MTEKWKGGAGVGTWIQSPNPEACEAAGALGYDFCIIDMEHGVFGWDTTIQLVRAVQAFGSNAIVRVLSGDQRTLQKALDLGVDGILVPKVETAEQAADIVAACTYPGKGIRGACGTTRSNMHGAREFRANPKDGLHIWGLVETATGLANVDTIAASGLTGIVMGPFDLSFSLGFAGDISGPEMWEAQQKMMTAAHKVGRDCIVCLNSTEPAALEQEVEKWHQAGAKTYSTPSDRAVIAGGFRHAMKTCRAVL